MGTRPSGLIPQVRFCDAAPQYNYTAYGLNFISDYPIPSLLPAPASNSSVRIKCGSSPALDSSAQNRKLRYATSYLTDTGEPSLRIWDVNDGEFLCLLYSDDTEFWLDRALKTLWVRWPPTSNLDAALSYLVGPVLGLLLRLRGTVCLHASAVAVNDRIVVFVGPEGAGKSTTAAGFAQLGHAVSSDDIVALVEHEQQFQVLPAYPSVNLWPDSVEKLYGSPDALPPITADWDKRFLALNQGGIPQFEPRQLPIGAIYFFDDPADAAEQCVEPLSKKEALLTLVANTYATNFLDAQQRAEEFAVLSRLVARVPVRKVNPKRDLVSIYALCKLIHRDFTGIDSPASQNPG